MEMEVVKNWRVFGLENSFKASKYPMAVNTDNVSSKYTATVERLGRCRKGEGHDNFLCGIVVQFDLTFTVKGWTEAERYHFFEIVSSQSTMHRITKFNLDEAYIEYVDGRMIEIMKEKVAAYNAETNEAEKKEKYLEILYSNPCGMKLTARVTTNYRQLKTIYSQRRTHKLPEWRAFCEWIEKLPFANLIT